MGELVRLKDWSKTPFGPIETWPQSLRTAISMMLESRFAMVVAWGPEFRFFYNDRYRPVLGATKHPSALGSPAQQIFPEAWPFIGPLFNRTRAGESVALDDQLIPLDRNGYLENCYFTLSYSGIHDETGGVGGMLAVVVETTDRVHAERRLAALRDLLRAAAECKTVEAACENATRIFDKNPIDVPFALLYLASEDGRSARLVSSSALSPGMRACPKEIDLTSDALEGWPVARAVRSRKIEAVTDLPSRFGPLPGGPHPESTHTAIIASLAKPGSQHPYAILIAGVSPRRALDDAYGGFFDLAADHVLSAVSNARAFEELQRELHISEMFVGVLGHDLRNPLSAIYTAALLLSRRAESEAIAKPVSRVLASAERMTRMLDQLLDCTRIRLGRGLPIERENVDLTGICQAVIDELEPTQGCSIQLEHAGDLVGLWDRDRLSQLVSNLAGNACQHRRPQTPVAMRVDGTRPSSVMIEVRNEGVISADVLSVIFDPSQVGTGKKRTGSSGLGLGLYISQQIVIAHGGMIVVESNEEQGTRFLVELPRR